MDIAVPDRRDFSSPVDTADVRDNPGCPRLQRYPSPAKARAARPLPGQTHAADPVPRTQLKNRVQSRLSRTQPPPRSRLPACMPPKRASMRSEEHTSELQSLMRNSYAVFCLKKKIT